jgi:hypothetical protein
MPELLKAGWPAGPWTDEPDRVEFEHAGLPCLILRNRMGTLCGYAAVAPGHPWHGKRYDADEVDVDVHGGLTYSDKCRDQICHVAKPGESDDVYWFGFDCGHAWDITPAMLVYHEPFEGEVYRDIAYVRREVESLAEQLSRVSV